MNKDFRERVFMPLMLPIGALVLFAAFAISLSRVFLAVPPGVAALLALLVAGYLLLVGGLISARHRIGSTALGIGVVLGMVGVVAAGAVAAATGMREAAHGEEPAEEPGGEEGEGAAGASIPEGSVIFVAQNISYTDVPATAPAGEVPLAIENLDAIPHDVTIDELGVKVASQGNETIVETVTLEPGTWTYYCSVPGHRQAGMEGTIEVQ